eukprot:CAMPEP_0116874580 /NCGR_PEP_ID=MMETSP0463-20121206/6053_1 /TAXON_ID=181622 /ORGANISM="Strombidinopsis sp, Strain SopsisLIS2011" /LENGTH=108 /DNA_ID=CAMNT_0004518389 /DNA_START=1142 /DNA_END=1468 /DNA_ORIENTATION=+
MGDKAHRSYKLKDNTRVMNSNANKYTQEQKEKILMKMQRMLYYFGYVKHPEMNDLDSTASFDAPNNKHDPEMLKIFGKFRADNDFAIDYLNGKSDSEISKEFCFQPYL